MLLVVCGGVLVVCGGVQRGAVVEATRVLCGGVRRRWRQWHPCISSATTSRPTFLLHVYVSLVPVLLTKLRRWLVACVGGLRGSLLHARVPTYTCVREGSVCVAAAVGAVVNGRHAITPHTPPTPHAHCGPHTSSHVASRGVRTAPPPRAPHKNRHRHHRHRHHVPWPVLRVLCGRGGVHADGCGRSTRNHAARHGALARWRGCVWL